MQTKIASKDSLINKLLGFSMASWVSAALSFFITPFITRMFSPEEMGKINMFFMYLTIFQYICILGLNQGYIRFYNEPLGKNDKDGMFKLCVLIALIFSIAINIFTIIFWREISVQITNKESINIVICLIICTICNVFLTISNSYYRMEKNIILYSIQAILITLAGKISYIIAILWVPNHIYAINIMTISFVILASIFIYIQINSKRNSKTYITKDEYIPLLKFSIPVVPVMLLSWVNTSLPKLILKEHVGYSAIGIYSSAITIVSIITILQSGFNTFWPGFVYENYKNSQKKITKVHQLITFFMVMFGLMILLNQDILYLIIGPNYRESKDFFAFLLLSPILYSIGETTGLGINISKKSYLNIIVTSISAFTSLYLSNKLIPLLGTTGASIAVAISAILMFLVKTIIGERYYKCINNYYKTFSTIGVFVIASILNYILKNSNIYRLSSLLILLIVLILINRQEVEYIIYKVSNILKKTIKFKKGYWNNDYI